LPPALASSPNNPDTLVITMMQAHWIARVLSHRVLVWLGRLSYAIYVIHLPMQAIFQSTLRPQMHTLSGFLLMFPFMALVILTAHLSYRYYESWFLTWKDRLAAR